MISNEKRIGVLERAMLEVCAALQLAPPPSMGANVARESQASTRALIHSAAVQRRVEQLLAFLQDRRIKGGAYASECRRFLRVNSAWWRDVRSAALSSGMVREHVLAAEVYPRLYITSVGRETLPSDPPQTEGGA